MLWLFAGSAVVNLQAGIGNSTECRYSVEPSSLYKTVNIKEEEGEIEALISKLNEEISIGKEITGIGKNLSLTLPSPEPAGYEQREVEITCTNYSNESVPVTGSVTITGNINNPWLDSTQSA